MKNFVIALFVIALLVLSVLTLGFVGVGNSQKEAVEYSLIEHRVESGNRVWNIARQYNSDSVDPREVVYYFKKVNGGVNIKAGETVKVPVLEARGDSQ